MTVQETCSFADDLAPSVTPLLLNIQAEGGEGGGAYHLSSP